MDAIIKEKVYISGAITGVLDYADKFNKAEQELRSMGFDVFNPCNMGIAFRHGEEWLDQLLPYLSDNFDFVVDYCEKHIPRIKTYAPDATYLMWLDCRRLGLDDQALREFMIHKAGLGLNEGHYFGRSLSGFMRLNAACPRSVLQKAMEQLEDAVKTL